MQAVIIQAPLMVGAGGSPVYLPATNNRTNPWSTGLCGCFDDCGICIKGYFCFCCLVADNGAKLDGDTVCMGCCYPASPFKNRQQAASLLGLQSTCMENCMISTFCACCSEMQVARELSKFSMMQNSAPAQLVFGGQGGGPQYLPRQGMKRNTWKTGLCDCFSNCTVCIKGYFCLCCLSNDNSARMDGDRVCCGCCYGGAKNRTQAMALLGIEPTCSECLQGTFCICCSEMQIARELETLTAMQMGGGGFAAAPPQQVMANSNYVSQ